MCLGVRMKGGYQLNGLGWIDYDAIAFAFPKSLFVNLLICS